MAGCGPARGLVSGRNGEAQCIYSLGFAVLLDRVDRIVMLALQACCVVGTSSSYVTVSMPAIQKYSASGVEDELAISTCGPKAVETKVVSNHQCRGATIRYAFLFDPCFGVSLECEPPLGGGIEVCEGLDLALRSWSSFPPEVTNTGHV